MKNKQKTKSPVGKSVLTLLCIGLAASLASIASVQAVIIDDFQSYTAGSNLLGQGPWLSTSPADTGVGITVEDIGGGSQGWSVRGYQRGHFGSHPAAANRLGQ